MLKAARYLSKYLIKDALGDLDGIRVVPSKRWGQIGLERFIAGAPLVASVLHHFPEAKVTRVRVPNSPIVQQSNPLAGLTWRQSVPDWVVCDDGKEIQRFAEFDDFWSWWLEFGPVDDDPAPRAHHGSLLFRPWRDWNSSDRSVRRLTDAETASFNDILAECDGGVSTDVAALRSARDLPLPETVEVAFDDGVFTDADGNISHVEAFTLPLARRAHAPRSDYAKWLRDKTTWAGEFLPALRVDPDPAKYAAVWSALALAPCTPGALASRLKLGNTLVGRIFDALHFAGFIQSDNSGRFRPVASGVVVPRLADIRFHFQPRIASPGSLPALPPARELKTRKGLPARVYHGAYSEGRPSYAVPRSSHRAFLKRLSALEADQVARGGGPSPDPDPVIAAEKANLERVTKELRAKHKAAPRRSTPNPISVPSPVGPWAWCDPPGVAPPWYAPGQTFDERAKAIDQFIRKTNPEWALASLGPPAKAG